MTYKEAAKRILNHMKIHARSEKPFAIHITKALKLVVRTLLEAEQREKGCKYCQKLIYKKHFNPIEITEENIPQIQRVQESVLFEFVRLENKFCPMCGRKLGE